MRKIAIIADGFIRDSQAFFGDPSTIDADASVYDPEWEDNFTDIKNPAQYVGIVDGQDDAEMREKAAAIEGVPPDIITLIEM